MKTKKITYLSMKSHRLEMLLLATLFTFGSVFVSAQNQTKGVLTYYVSTSGSDANDGLTWATAFSTIQKGIDEAATIGAEVWVSEGTYYPTANLSDSEGETTSDAYKSIIMRSGVNVYGGFAGTETTKEIGVVGGREITDDETWSFANPTIIDGTTTGSYHCVWYATNGFEAFEYMGVTNIMIPSPLEDVTIMDGFTISGGFANLDIRLENTTTSKNKFIHLGGGGVTLIGSGHLQNCIIQNNKAKYGGGGVAMFNGAVMENCLIQNNEAIGANFYSAGFLGFGAFDYWRADGAGVAAMGFDYECIIDNCVITNNVGNANDNYPDAASSLSNKTNNGGGVYIFNSTIQNSVVSSNNIAVNPSPYDEGASASCGGGMYVYASGLVDNCEVTDNGFISGSQNGAGVFIADYSTEATSYDDIIFRNSFVHSNRAGGAMAVDAQYSTIENNIVANNNGAGIYGYGNCTRMRTINCLVYNNSSTGWGHSTSTNNAQNQLINSTIVRNGTGVSIGNTNNHVVSNSIIWGNNSNPTTISNATVSYSAFSFTPPAGTGNIQITTDNTEAKFVNPTASHTLNLEGWENADFSLEMGSACIDVADETLLPAGYTYDILGNGRVVGCGLDMGAYESVLGGTVISLAIDAVDFGQSTEVSDCANTEYVLTFAEAVSGTMPYTVSWTVNGSSSHSLAGNDVEINTVDQELLNFVATEDLEIQFTSIVDNNSCPGNPDLYQISIDTYQPEPTFIVNLIDVQEVPEIDLCVGETIDFRCSVLESVDYPITASWTVNGETSHPMAGTDVEITSDDFELYNGVQEPGTYEIVFTSISDAYGCQVIDLSSFDVDIIINNQPEVNITVNDLNLSETLSTNYCHDVSVEMYFVNVSSGEYPFILSWTVNGSNEHAAAGNSVEIDADGQALISQILPEGTYEIDFTSIVDANGCSITDLTEYQATIIVDNCSNIKSKEFTEISIFPNPVSNTLNLIVPENQNCKNARIVNLLGENIMQFDLNNTTEIDVQHLQHGTYIIIIEADQELNYIKFIKR